MFSENGGLNMPFWLVLSAYILFPLAIFGGAEYVLLTKFKSCPKFYRYIPPIIALAVTAIAIAVIVAVFLCGDIISTTLLNGFVWAGVGGCGAVGSALGFAVSKIKR